MKKITLILIAVVIVSGITTLALNPLKSNPNNEIILKSSTSFPDSVKTILKNSCFACHATGGKQSALMVLNLDKWDSYSPKKQTSKAIAMAKEMKSNSMPPAGFLSKNPNSTPTKAQINTVANWANSLK
jgi:cytochrome c5